MEATDVLGRRLVWRSAKEIGEPLDGSYVPLLSLRRHSTHGHLVDHALAQRADDLIGHKGPPVLGEVVKPLNLKTGRSQPATLPSLPSTAVAV